MSTGTTRHRVNRDDASLCQTILYVTASTETISHRVKRYDRETRRHLDGGDASPCQHRQCVASSRGDSLRRRIVQGACRGHVGGGGRPLTCS